LYLALAKTVAITDKNFYCRVYTDINVFHEQTPAVITHQIGYTVTTTKQPKVLYETELRLTL